jgi:hypothetical protein
LREQRCSFNCRQESLKTSNNYQIWAVRARFRIRCGLPEEFSAEM